MGARTRSPAMGHPMIRDVIGIVREAGRIIQEIRRHDLEVASKEGQGPVTRADQAADEHLRAALQELGPGGWLSEETADDLSRREARRIWIVDPLDGTREFILDLPEYAVSVALVERDIPVLAVVHHPATAETFWAAKEEGAFQGNRRLRIRDGRILLASRSELEAGEFRPFDGEWLVRPCGSIAYKLARVARGDGAATLSRGPKWEWDVCAGALLVSEAGGVVTDARGRRPRFNQALPRFEGFLGGAPEAHDALLARVRQVGVVPREGPAGDVPTGG
jgi:myo-inositol-1(or 4)-monophosphatase